jgi:hypothetical protein
VSPAAASNRCHDRPFRASSDVRLESSFANPLNNVLNLLFGGVVRHVDDHGSVIPFLLVAQIKKPRFDRGFGGEL